MLNMMLRSKIDTRLTTVFTAAAVGLMAFGPTSAWAEKYYMKQQGQVYEMSESAAQQVTPGHQELLDISIAMTADRQVAEISYWKLTQAPAVVS
jgi:hypothetical protein